MNDQNLESAYNHKLNTYSRIRREYLSRELIKEIIIIQVVLTKGGFLHKQSRLELEHLGIKLHWKRIIRTIIINNTIDVLTILSNRFRASGKTNLEENEDDEKLQSKSLESSIDDQDNKCINDIIVIDSFFSPITSNLMN